MLDSENPKVLDFEIVSDLELYHDVDDDDDDNNDDDGDNNDDDDDNNNRWK